MTFYLYYIHHDYLYYIHHAWILEDIIDMGEWQMCDSLSPPIPTTTWSRTDLAEPGESLRDDSYPLGLPAM